jgi:phage-related protein
MPVTTVHFYQESEGKAPVLEWLKEVRANKQDVTTKFKARIKALRERGIELDMPISEHLSDGIFQLRFNVGRVNYRFLYFFHGADVAIVAHCLTKEKKVPQKDIEIAKDHRANYVSNPEKCTYKRRVDQ